ncbi:MAG TPA: c-type cytochrome domain-containing protein, partial [Terriglobia bacterium]|nr:c-type cytochrome domain-containing protein [Terriglobia bacterium]
MFRLAFVAVLLFLGKPAAAEENPAIFQKRVYPLLHTHCASCHGTGSPQSNLSVLSLEGLLRGGKHGPALTPGSSQKSLLMAYVRGEISPKMPLAGSLP